MHVFRFVVFFIMSATVSMAGQAERLVAALKMEKIPVEGAWFAVTYNSADKLSTEALPTRYGAPRIAGSAIYAMVTPVEFSAMHKLKTDEIWHFYVGDPIELLLLHEGTSEVVVIGPDVLAGQKPQFTVPAGTWMGARPLSTKADAYSLFGCTLAPGFDYADFETGYRDELQKAYPKHAVMIGELTREECATLPKAVAASETSPKKVEASSEVFSPSVMTAVAIAPGVDLRELIGRTGHAKTDRSSIAHFTLAPGKTTGTSYNKAGEEYFLVISGKGMVKLGNEQTLVGAGSVVVMRPLLHHSITAVADSSLEFYAITTPAFSLDDYVRVSDAP